jgi:hypothetical protein
LRAASTAVTASDPWTRLVHPIGKISWVSPAAASTTSATGRCVVCPVARHAAARPVTQSRYCGLSTGLVTRNSKVAASGASAANSGRHRARPEAISSRQPITAATARARPRSDASCASATCPPLSWYAPNRYATVPCQPACRQIMNGVAATDSISTPRAFWCARKLAVPLAKKAQTAASTAAAAAIPRRCWPGASPASSVTGHAFTAAPAPIRAPRTLPRPVTHRAATDSATGTTSNLPTVTGPSSGTPHTQYQAPASDPPRRARKHSMKVMARSQPMARNMKWST